MGGVAETVDGCVIRSLQQFITTASWDADTVPREVRRQVADGWDGDAVVTVDETGFGAAAEPKAVIDWSAASGSRAS